MSKEASKEHLVDRMQTIDPYDFEAFVARIWGAEGWSTSVEPDSNDMGVDVVARKHGGVIDQKLVIQTKRYSDGNKVGRPEVQQYLALREQDAEADAVAVVTTSDFTNSAQVWADNHNVKLVDGEDLAELVRKHNLHQLLEQYEQRPEPADETSSVATADQSDSVDVALEADPPNIVGGLQERARQVAYWLASLGLFIDARYGDLNRMATDYSPWLPFLAVLQWASVFLIEVPALAGVAGAVLVIGWLGSPMVVYWDAQMLHEQDAPTRPNRIVWPAISLFPLFGVLIYLWWRA